MEFLEINLLRHSRQKARSIDELNLYVRGRSERLDMPAVTGIRCFVLGARQQ